jgi:cyanophycinase
MHTSKFLIAVTVLMATMVCVNVQKQATGKLFIIGGGDRPPNLMQSLAKEAALSTSDYGIVLPMSSGQPDTSFFYFMADWLPVCSTPLYNFNFTTAKSRYQPWLDSLTKAKFIFITGGDQDRFMKIVAGSPIYTAIHQAYQNGATIAGTSAGAAVMSQDMITGNQLQDSVYRATFPRLVANNVEFKIGLGLIANAIIDQHFVVRSRYNRLLSALAAYPTSTCIGIDEETAIVVQGNRAKVVGNSQVIVAKQPRKLTVTAKQLIKFQDVQLSIFTEGDEFLIR